MNFIFNPITDWHLPWTETLFAFTSKTFETNRLFKEIQQVSTLPADAFHFGLDKGPPKHMCLKA